MDEQHSRGGALHALTAAALALPGLDAVRTLRRAGQCGGDPVRPIPGERPRPLRRRRAGSSRFESDSLQASAWFLLTDRLKTLVNFRQDTWSGATPIATAPREWRGNRSRAPDGVSGASPYLVSSNPLFLDRKTLAPLRTDGFGNLTGGEDTQLVHTISGASREIRKQLDLDLRYEWNEAALDVNGGVSSEPDYLSRFVGIGGQWDFNQKLTTVNAGISYTYSTTRAILDHDATPYIYNACGTPRCNFVSSTSRIEDSADGGKILYGNRRDLGATLGLTQIINKDAQVQTNLGYTRSDGYLSNPYKVVEVAFIDPQQQFLAPSPDVLYVNVNSMLDKRPDLRNQWLWNIRYAQYIEGDGRRAAPQLRVLPRRLGHPRSHGGSVVGAAVRQRLDDHADDPLLHAVGGVFLHPVPGDGSGSVFDPNGSGDGKPRHRPVRSVAAADVLFQRLSTCRRSARWAAASPSARSSTAGVTGYLGYAYYRHSGKLKAGGGGEGAYSDFSSWLLNASLTIDLNYASSVAGRRSSTHPSRGKRRSRGCARGARRAARSSTPRRAGAGRRDVRSRASQRGRSDGRPAPDGHPAGGQHAEGYAVGRRCRGEGRRVRRRRLHHRAERGWT